MSNDARAFLDTAYVYALINSRDQWHARAKHWELVFTAQKRAIMTSEFILMEIADGLAAIRYRNCAVDIVDTLTSSSLVDHCWCDFRTVSSGIEVVSPAHGQRVGTH